MWEAAKEFDQATNAPTKYVDEKTRKENEKRQAIIEVESRDINDIDQGIVKTAAKEKT